MADLVTLSGFAVLTTCRMRGGTDGWAGGGRVVRQGRTVWFGGVRRDKGRGEKYILIAMHLVPKWTACSVMRRERSSHLWLRGF